MSDDSKAVSDGRGATLSGVVGGRIVTVDPLVGVDVREMWWAAGGAFRGSGADLRNRRVLAGEVLSPQSREVPDPELRLFRPACAHDRTSDSIMNCPECAAWTAAHWCDRIG